MPLDGTLYHPQDGILRVLSAAQERIREPENWRQHDYGRFLEQTGPICADGALLFAVNPDQHSLFRQASRLLCRAAHEQKFQGSIDLNDSTDHPTVMAMFSRAIELRLADIAKEAVHVL